jgi:signal transduction histidine kinase
MKHKSYEEQIRLAVLIPYYLFHLPLFIQLFFPDIRMPMEIKVEKYLVWVLIFCFLVYLVLELFEYLFFRYSRQSKSTTMILTGIRITVWILSVITAFHLQGIPVYDLLIPFFVFNLYFVFPIKISFSIMLAATGYTVLVFSLQENPIPENLSYFLLILRVLNIIILYAFAHFWENSRQKRVENEALLKRLHAFADGVSKQVALEERTRLARDIHDNIGHFMTVIQIQLAKAEAFFDREPEIARSSVISAKEAAREAMSEIRQSLDTLNNPDRNFILKAELARLAQLLEKNGLKVIYNFKGEQEGYNYAVLLAVYRMVQEGITNILKHANAHTALVIIALGAESGLARVEDDGIGMLITKEPPTGYGLSGLLNRFSLVHGWFTVSSRPGGGTTLSAGFPRDPLKTIGVMIE